MATYKVGSDSYVIAQTCGTMNLWLVNGQSFSFFVYRHEAPLLQIMTTEDITSLFEVSFSIQAHEL